jgi:AcrR family transcriptional regulator
MELKYHDGMRVPRQEENLTAGRVNQKRRTRTAIVDAARRLLADGVMPTVSQAAAAAEVSRTTAYRYFPTQDALLLEVAMHADVGDIEELAAEGGPVEVARERTLAVLELFNRHVADAEVQYRTALRLYLDQWLAQVEAGDPSPEVREGRRRRWFEQTLDPLRDTVTDEAWHRAITVLCLLSGPEALVVLRDVSHLEPEAGRDAVRWAAETLLDATFR